MLDKLEAIKNRYLEVGEQLAQASVMADIKQYTALGKEYKDLTKVVEVYDQYTRVLRDTESAKALLHAEKDPAFREMAREELDTLEAQRQPLEAQLKLMLSPKDPNDAKNVILEIRAGIGGDETRV